MPVGSVEPHGPHLPLATDTLISGGRGGARVRGARRARASHAVVAPSVPYGVTDFAEGFAGAVERAGGGAHARCCARSSTRLRRGRLVARLPREQPPRAGARRGGARGGRRASPGARRSRARSRGAGRARCRDEFKRGDCHAGRYETSLVLAAEGRGEATSAGRSPRSASACPTASARAGKRFRDIGMDARLHGRARRGDARGGRGALREARRDDRRRSGRRLSRLALRPRTTSPSPLDAPRANARASTCGFSCGKQGCRALARAGVALAVGGAIMARRSIPFLVTSLAASALASAVACHSSGSAANSPGDDADAQAEGGIAVPGRSRHRLRREGEEHPRRAAADGRRDRRPSRRPDAARPLIDSGCSCRVHDEDACASSSSRSSRRRSRYTDFADQAYPKQIDDQLDDDRRC